MSDAFASPAPAPPAPSDPPAPAASSGASTTAFDATRPLGGMALALSGGGYRAAAFHLGTLRLLHRVGLLPSVVGLSTVSGGTICGMAWVVSMLDGKSFEEFDASFSAYLKCTNVIGQALEGLRAERKSGEWASLIRAAADVYDRPDFLGGRRLREVLDAQGLQLEEVIFNTTEFHTGLDFRFRRSGDAKAIIGNWNFRVPRAVAEHVRLADVVAGSSCFPGGFEPIVFPQQFRWPGDFPLDRALKELPEGFQGGLPLMDGGVYDNQGLESLQYAFSDRIDRTTFVVSDVSARNNSMYDVPKDPGSRGFLTLRGVGWLALLMLLLALASAGVLFWKGYETARAGDWGWDDYLLYLVPGLLAAGVGLGLWWARRRIREANRLVRDTVDTDVWPSLEKLTVPEFTQMLTLRVTSLLSLTSSVFMARIRRLIFNRVWEDKRYEDRRIANLIYALERDDELFGRFPWLRPSDALKEQAKHAERMSTTLWFNDDKEFATVSGTGQCTICFVLLRHIVRDRPGEYEQEGAPLHALYQTLRREWDACNASAAAAPAAAPPPAARVSIWGT